MRQIKAKIPGPKPKTTTYFTESNINLKTIFLLNNDFVVTSFLEFLHEVTFTKCSWLFHCSIFPLICKADFNSTKGQAKKDKSSASKNIDPNTAKQIR